MKHLLFRSVFIAIALAVISGCASYYRAHGEFNSEFEHGDLERALETLGKYQNESESKTRFIYFVNKGLLLSILGQYEESNSYLEKAFMFGEDYRINYFDEATSYFTNPNVILYRGEDHEHLMLLYFKAINFLKLGRHEDALVECRRLNIRLNQLGDKYVSEDKLQRNAFIHTLMGIIYQSSKDHNNAFIAYRNAVEVYESDYSRMFGMLPPEQLKKDLLDAAWRTGFMDEFDSYKNKFEMNDYVVASTDADLVFFWHNGLGPVKAEWSINFVITPGPDHMMVFNNQELGLSFPFKVDDDKERSDLASLQFFRVAFPKYVERQAYYLSATVERGPDIYNLELAEDINKIAFYSLNQRMLQEFSKGLLRAALKKAAEQTLRKKDDRLGAVLGIVNAITEKADTRNWQTLPHSIYYSRIPLREGKNDLRLLLQSGRNQDSTAYNFTYQVSKGQTLFHTFSSLETVGAPYRYY